MNSVSLLKMQLVLDCQVSHLSLQPLWIQPVSIFFFHKILLFTYYTEILFRNQQTKFNSILYIDPPAPPGFPKVVDTTKSSVELAWTKPAYDGGSEIIGYIIEMANPESPDKFLKVASPTITKYTVTGVKEGREYRFRVKAVNAIGDSEPSDVPNAVIPKDILGEFQIIPTSVVVL